MLDISKYCFGFSRAFLAYTCPGGQCQGSDALLGKQVLFGLLAKALEFKTDLNVPIAFCFCALRFERTGGALSTFIKAAF